MHVWHDVALCGLDVDYTVRDSQARLENKPTHGHVYWRRWTFILRQITIGRDEPRSGLETKYPAYM